VWHITEEEYFFLKVVPLERNITHPKKRLQHLAGRYLLKELYPNFSYGLIRISANRKPYLENEACHFSVSHCSDYAAVVVSESYQVGVDVETITERVHRVQHKFMSATETGLLEKLADPVMHNFTTLLTLSWSIKETLFKWAGTGELDFKEHLHIEAINLCDEVGIAKCIISKGGAVRLDVHFRLIGDQCLSWVCSKPGSS
jgi:phosphopantetheinyl transferase